MRILIFNWRDLKHPQGGGAELFLHEQAKIWVKQGNKVTWITGCFKNSKKREIIDGIEFIRIGNDLSLYLLAPFKYFKIRKNFDVIIDAENGIPFFTSFFTKKKKILLIHHIHKDVWKKEKRFPLSKIGYILEMKLMPKLYKNTKIVTVSPSSNIEIKKLFKKEAEIIYNGVNLNRYAPGIKAKNPEIVFIGRLKKYKSIDVLLNALNLLKDEKITTYILGSGDDEKRLKNITRKLRLSNVFFLGHVNEKEKIKHLQRAWVVVNPSMIEGWSITNIEANACKTIVLGSNVNGIKDSIINNKTGLLFEYGNYKELAEKIKRVIKNRVEREKMEKEAVKWSKNFTWENAANKFYKILKEL